MSELPEKLREYAGKLNDGNTTIIEDAADHFEALFTSHQRLYDACEDLVKTLKKPSLWPMLDLDEHAGVDVADQALARAKELL